MIATFSWKSYEAEPAIRMSATGSEWEGGTVTEVAELLKMIAPFYQKKVAPAGTHARLWCKPT